MNPRDSILQPSVLFLCFVIVWSNVLNQIQNSKTKVWFFLFFFNRNSAPESGTINILSHGSPASLFTITPEKLATKWKVSAIATVTSFSTTSSNSCKILRSTQLFNIKKEWPSPPHPSSFLCVFVRVFPFEITEAVQHKQVCMVSSFDNQNRFGYLPSSPIWWDSSAQVGLPLIQQLPLGGLCFWLPCLFTTPWPEGTKNSTEQI